MTALLVIGVILLIIIAFLLLRVELHIEYGEKFTFSVYFARIKLYPISKKEKRQEKKNKPKKDKPHDKKENLIKKTYKDKGFEGTFKLFSYVIKRVAEKLLWLLKRLKIRNFRLDLSVRGDNAADTAIKYGGVCAAVYPLIAFLDSNLNIKLKNIDISPLFEGKKSSVSFSAQIKAEIIVLLAVAISAFCEYKKIRDVFFNERKQH